MSWESFRDWVVDLERRGDLKVVDDPVSTEFEIAAYIKKSCNEDGPAFRFENVDDSKYDVVGGLYGSQRRLLEALSVDSHPEGVQKYLSASENRIEPVVVDDGPVKDTVDTDPNLYDVPIVRHSEEDGGHYVTAGIQVAHLPHTGVQGQGIYRMPRHSETELGLYSPEERRVGRAYRINADRGEPTEIAIVLGASPEVTMGSITNAPHTVDKFSVAGGFKGEPVELVECETIDLQVPARAEMIIEGVLHPDRTMVEGKFGEYPGCYGGQGEVPLVEVTAITHREDPMYHTILTGFPPTENNYMNWFGESATVMEDAQRAVPAVDQATVRCDPGGGNGRYEAFVSIDKRLDGEAWNVIQSVLGGRTGAKFCTVVDSDIDVYDERQRNWALNTRVQPDRDVHTYPEMVGGSLDPSGGNRQTQKVGIDATIPVAEDGEEYERVEVPGVDEVEW
jgi:UbiD family decarboxylase